MASPINDFIHQSWSSQDLASNTDFEAARSVLAGLLKGHMRRTGFWERPPAHLGLPWARSWSEGAALEELTADCFLFAVVRPLGTLVEFARSHSPLDPLVDLGVGWFLDETERLFDPLGHGLRKRLQVAARRLVRRGALYAETGASTIGPTVVLTFSSKGIASPSEDALRVALGDWVEDLTLELLTTRGPQPHPLTLRLEDRLRSLETAGVESFRILDLVETLRQAFNKRFGLAVLAVERPQDRIFPELEIPRHFEERRRFRTFLSCVGDSIDELTAEASTYGHLSCLWFFLRHRAHFEGTVGPTAEVLTDHLDISLNQTRSIFAILQRLLDVCRGATADEVRTPRAGSMPQVFPTAEVVSVQGLPAQGNPEHGNLAQEKGLAEALVAEFHTALAQLPERVESGSARDPSDLQVGMFSIVHTAGRTPLLWLTVETNGSAGTARLVPADLFPAVGHRDLVFEVAGLGPLRLRCDFEQEVPMGFQGLGLLQVSTAAATLTSAELERLVHHRRRRAVGDLFSDSTTRVRETEPALEDWLEQVVSPACHVLQSSLASAKNPGFSFNFVHLGPVGRLAALAFFLALALGILLRCNQKAAGGTEVPPAALVEGECATLPNAPPWCGNLEESAHARIDLRSHLIYLPQGVRPAGRTRDRFQRP